MIEEDFPDYLELWNDFRFPIQRADFIRYCILFKYGGLYLDCDIRPMKNLEDIFQANNTFVIGLMIKIKKFIMLLWQLKKGTNYLKIL